MMQVGLLRFGEATLMKAHHLSYLATGTTCPAHRRADFELSWWSLGVQLELFCGTDCSLDQL